MKKRVSQKWIGWGLLVLAAGVILSGLVLWSGWAKDEVRVVFCDVGQGDGALVRAPGGAVMLVDTGPMGGGMLKCLGENLPFYQRKLAVVVISHPQADHAGELLRILDRYQVERVVMIDSQHETAVIEALRDKIAEKGVEWINPKRGDIIQLGGERSGFWPRWGMAGGKRGGGGERTRQVRWLVAWPPVRCGRELKRAECAEGNINELSVSGKLEYGRFGVWFWGDLSAEAQARMGASEAGSGGAGFDPFEMKNDKNIWEAEVLKWPHHGSGQTGVDDELMMRVAPKLAVVSVGAGNRFGHPSERLLASWERRGVTVKRTDKEGAITVVSDGRSWKVEANGKSDLGGSNRR